MRFVMALSVTVLLVASGCGKKVDPRTTQAWERACHAQDSVMQHGDAVQYNAGIVQWINAHAHDETVTATFAKAQTLTTPEDKAKLVRGAASDSGVSDCPVVDAMWPPAKK